MNFWKALGMASKFIGLFSFILFITLPFGESEETGFRLWAGIITAAIAVAAYIISNYKAEIS